jgi:hypothetical protein
MPRELEVEVNALQSAGSNVILSRQRRISELEGIMEKKYAELVASCSEYHAAFETVEEIAGEGIIALFTSLAEDMRGIDQQLIHDHERRVADHRSQFESLFLRRKAFELEQYLPKLIKARQGHLENEICLLNEISTSKHSTEEAFKSKVGDLRLELEALPSQQIRDRHKLEHEIDVYTFGIEESKRAQRKAKKDAIKLHTRRNEMRAEHVIESTKAESAETKLRAEIQRLEKNVVFFETKLSQIAKINASKYKRISESNLREIGYISTQLVEGITTVYREIFGLSWRPDAKFVDATSVITEKRIDQFSDDIHSLFKALGSPASESDLQELEGILAELEQQHKLLMERSFM